MRVLSPGHGAPGMALMGQQHPWVGCSPCAMAPVLLAAPWHKSTAMPWRQLGDVRLRGCSRIPHPQGAGGAALPSCLILSIATEVGKTQQEGADGFLQMVPC